METIQSLSSILIDLVVGIARDLIQILPEIIGALLLLIGGWVVARLARALATRLIRGIGRISVLVRITSMESGPNIGENTIAVVGNVIFWIVILFFLTSATSLLGMSMFADWLNQLVNHLPNIISGLLIICVGIIFGNLANQAVATAATNLSRSQRIALARIAQFFVLIMLVLIGVDQIGIDITAVIIIVSVVIGSLLAGLAIAFGGGARTLVSNLIGVRYLRRDYAVGEQISIGEHEGTILEVSSVAIVIATQQGRVTIPARLFSEQPSTLIVKEPNDG